MISGSLGYLIYQQRHAASESIEGDLAALDAGRQDRSRSFQEHVAAGMAPRTARSSSRWSASASGSSSILSLYLVIMTHKVAGPLYKVSLYFDRMADGRSARSRPYDKATCSRTSIGNFREMHDAVRARAQPTSITMESAATRAAREGCGQRADIAARRSTRSTKHAHAAQAALS